MYDYTFKHKSSIIFWMNIRLLMSYPQDKINDRNTFILLYLRHNEYTNVVFWRTFHSYRIISTLILTPLHSTFFSKCNQATSTWSILWTNNTSSVEILVHHYGIFAAQVSLINQTGTGLDRMSLELMFVCRHIKKVMGGIKFLS